MLSAVGHGLLGALLVGGPIGAGLRVTWEVLATGGALAVLVAITAWRRPSAANPLLGLPLAGVAAAMHLSPDFAHLVTQLTALGWVLGAALPLSIALTAQRAGGSSVGVDLAYGGAAGLGSAVLVHVAAVDASEFDPVWALIGWVLGAAVIGGLARLPPRPAARTPRGLAWRTLPFAAAWIMAVVTAIPGAPRHELATSAGAQALAVTVAIELLLLALALWWGERIRGVSSPWQGLRLTLRRFLPAITTGTLLIVGALQAASYSAVTMDDLARFWIVADRLTDSGHFPVWDDRTWATLPGLPIAVLMAFALLGHTFPAVLAPMFLANTLLPWLIYRATLALGTHQAPAFAVALLAVIFPPIQIYSLGAAEPDPMFIAILAATAWAFAHALRTPHPRWSPLVLGGLAAVLTATRPEGPLYGGLLVLAALAGLRSRWAVGGGVIFAGLLLPLVVFSLAELGRPWPTPGQEFGFDSLVHHAGVIGGSTWPKVARVVLLNDVRFPLLMAAILALFAIGAVHASRRRWALAALPAAAILNVVIALSLTPTNITGTPTDIRAHLPDDFVRHVAYPLPIVAALAAVGLTALAQLTPRRLHAVALAIGVASAVYLAAGSLYLLGTPEEFHHGHNSGSLLPDNIYVNAPELWMQPLEIPRAGSDLPEFRRTLFAWYAPFDNRSDPTGSKSAGAAYQTLTAAVAALGFGALLAATAAPTTPPSGRPDRRRAPP